MRSKPDVHRYPASEHCGVEQPGDVPKHLHVASSVTVGHEFSFTRDSDKPKPLRHSGEIRADVLNLEQETEGLLAMTIDSASE